MKINVFPAACYKGGGDNRIYLLGNARGARPNGKEAGVNPAISPNVARNYAVGLRERKSLESSWRVVEQTVCLRDINEKKTRKQLHDIKPTTGN